MQNVTKPLNRLFEKAGKMFEIQVSNKVVEKHENDHYVHLQSKSF